MMQSAQRMAWCSMAAVIAVAVLLLAPSAPAGAVKRTASASVATVPHGGMARPELQRRLDEVVAAGAPGIVALVNGGRGRRRDDVATGWRGARNVWQGTSGVSDLRTGRPIGRDDRFRVGSVTKSLVATVALQLVGERRLSLSDTVEQWLPGILPYGGQVSVRQVLNHTSGVPDYILRPIVELSRGNRFRSWQPRELVALVAGQPQEFPAGTAWSYSNTEYVLAGMIIERATGKALGHELERRIFRPLQLRDTSFPVNFPFLMGPHPRGYSLAGDDELGFVEGPLLDFTVYNPSLAWAAGSIVSDMDDLARFYRALLGGRLLAPELLTKMKTRVEIAPGVGYGLGMFVFDTPCGPLWGHGGAIPGFSNELTSSEDGTRQYGLMINADTAPEAVYEPLVLASQ
jgi:D-alanyl-D-alanine carboxypeptidase